MRCFAYGARSCECLRQCQERDYLSATWSNPAWFNCFERTGVAPELQLSDVPKAGEAATFYKDAFMREPISAEDLRDKQRDGFLRPVSLTLCPLGCSGEGECLLQPGASTPYCLCYPGFSGPDCSGRSNLCWNECSNHGQCIRGVCACNIGYFGIDCGVQLSKRARLPGGGPTVMTDPPVGSFENAPAPLPERPPAPESQIIDRKRYNRLKVKIWVVELPPWLTEAIDRDSNPNNMFDEIYSGGRRFIKALLNDWTVRTVNPYQANFFLFPTDNYGFTGGGNDPHPNVRRMVRYMQANYPAIWERNSGSDFLFWSVGDPGACPIPEDLNRMTWMVHFGLTNYTMQRPDLAKPGESCFYPDHGVVVNPHYRGLKEFAASTYRDSPPYAARDLYFFFAGALNPQWRLYSQGVRADVYEHHHTKPGWLITDGAGGGMVPVLDTMRRSKFCLAPMGTGWGIRLIQAMASGCIPVIIQDQVHQASEDVLHYEEFSVRVPRSDIPFLDIILGRITDDEVKAMQAAMKRVHTYFAWDDAGAGTQSAYDLVIMSLQRQLWKVLSKIDFPKGR